MEGAFEDDLEFVQVDGFGQKIIGARADGLEGIGFLALAGRNDDLGRAILGKQIGERGEPFLRAGRMRRQSQVQQHHQGRPAQEGLQGARTITRQRDFVVLCQRPLHLGADFLVVVNNQQFGFHLSWLE